MKRIAEKTHQDNFFSNPENARKYLENTKNSSKAKYSDFLKTIKKLNIKGNYLEVGSGPGILTQIIAKQMPDAKITAIDISKEMIEIAEQDIEQSLKDKINYHVADACNIETIKELGKFDLIYSTFTMHHWDNAEIAIKNLFSVLNQNGVLYLLDLKRVFPFYQIPSKSGFIRSIRASYVKKEIKEMLSNCNISDYQLKTLFPFFMQTILINKK